MATFVKSSTFTRSTFFASSLFQYLITSEFTELFPGLNKVHYPISDRKDFTVVLTFVVGRQNHINVKCPHFTIMMFSLKIYFVNWEKICRNLRIGSN